MDKKEILWTVDEERLKKKKGVTGITDARTKKCVSKFIVLSTINY